MPRGSLALRTSNATSGQAALEIIPPSGRAVKLREMTVYLAAATASTYGLGRPAAIGVGPTTPTTLLDEGVGDASATRTRVALAWTTTAPTAPAQFIRRISFPATIGSFVTWTWVERGLTIPAGGTLVLWNLGANGVLDVHVVVDE